MRRTLLLLCFVVSLLNLFFTTSCVSKDDKKADQAVHVSIDDVYVSLKDLSDNSNEYISVFEQQFFKMLKSYNDSCGAKFTLYIYGSAGDSKWEIGDVPLKYRKQFVENSSWLKFGYHSAVPGDPSKKDNYFYDFISSYKAVNNVIGNLSSNDNRTKYLRLEYYFATDSIRRFLGQDSVTLLCADDTRISYSLPQNISDSVFVNGSYQYENQNFLKTDLRIENMSTWGIRDRIDSEKGDTLVIFTHERFLVEPERRRDYLGYYKNKYKLNRIINILSKNNYKYIN